MSRLPDPRRIVLLAVGALALGCVKSPSGGFGFDAGTLATVGDSGSDETDESTGDAGPAGSTSDSEGGASSDAQDGSGEGSSGGAESSGSTTGEPGMVGGGCANGASTMVQSDIDTLVFTGSLRSFGHTGTAPHGSIFVLSSGDLCQLTVTIDPESTDDAVSALVRDGDDLAIPGTECAAMAGEPCTVQVPDGPGAPMALRIEVTDESDNQIGPMTISVSGTTEGLVAPVDVGAVFRNLDYADYVLFPVGPATGGYDFEWSATTAVSYNVGMMSPGGALSLALDTTSPNMTSWPKSGSPQGWYVLAASTTDPSAQGNPWTFALTP